MDKAIKPQSASKTSRPARFGGAIESARQIAGRQSLIALIDQMFVSGTSLLTTIVVGRYCGAEGLGLFSLAFSAVILMRSVQDTLVSAPYTVFRARVSERMTLSQHAGGAVAGSLLLGAVMAIAALLIAVALTASSQPAPVRALAWALVIAVPLSLGREFARRYEMARLDMGGALKIDGVVAVVQLSALLGLALGGQLASWMAILVIGLANGLVASLWVKRRREEFTFQRDTIGATIRHDWGFGRWLLADQLVCFTQLYAMHWILAAMLGTSATGIFAACASIAALASPLLQGVGNYLSPRFADAVARGDRQETISLYRRSSLLLASAVTLFAFVASIFGEQLLWLLYHDPAYSSYGVVVGILAFRMAFGIPAIAAHHAVVAMERPRYSAAATIMGLAATLLIAIPLIQMMGIVGAAIAVFVGTGCECLSLLIIFARCMRNWRWTDEHRDSAETNT